MRVQYIHAIILNLYFYVYLQFYLDIQSAVFLISLEYQDRIVRGKTNISLESK